MLSLCKPIFFFSQVALQAWVSPQDLLEQQATSGDQPAHPPSSATAKAFPIAESSSSAHTSALGTLVCYHRGPLWGNRIAGKRGKGWSRGREHAGCRSRVKRRQHMTRRGLGKEGR